VLIIDRKEHSHKTLGTEKKRNKLTGLINFKDHININKQHMQIILHKNL